MWRACVYCMQERGCVLLDDGEEEARETRGGEEANIAQAARPPPHHSPQSEQHHDDDDNQCIMDVRCACPVGTSLSSWFWMKFFVNECKQKLLLLFALLLLQFRKASPPPLSPWSPHTHHTASKKRAGRPVGIVPPLSSAHLPLFQPSHAQTNRKSGLPRWEPWSVASFTCAFYSTTNNNTPLPRPTPVAMADDDDDPYLAELLDLVNDDDVKPNGSSSTTTASAAAASSSSSSSSQSATKAKKPASSVLTSPRSYQTSDTHRETLKLLSQLSPAGANLPTAEDVQKAFRALYPPFQAPAPLVALDDDDDDDDEVSEINPSAATAGGGRAPPTHLEAVQEELEEHLDAMDLFALRDVIRIQVDAWHAGKRTALATVAAKERERKERKEEKEKETAKQRQKEEEKQQQEQQSKKRKKEVVEVEDEDEEEEEGKNQTSNSLSQSQLSQSQASQEDGDADGTNNNKKRKRGTGAVGGRATLPLMLPKSVGSSSTSRSFLVELDERDKAQDLTGDSGAVGRVHVEKKKGIILDLKGHQYLAHLRRCPTLLLVSVGEEEAKVEDVVENLCVLTHQHDQLEAMGGKVVSRAGEEGGEEGGEGGGGGDGSDYYRLSDESESEGSRKWKKKGGGGGDVGGGGGKKVVSKRSSGGGGVKKGKGGKGGKGGGGGASRKSAGSSSGAGKGKKAAASSKKQGPRKVSLRALKQQKKKKKSKKESDDDDSEDEEEEEEEEEESFREQDDDDDSDFSI